MKTMISNHEIYTSLKELNLNDVVKKFEINGNILILDILCFSPALHEKRKIETNIRSVFKKKYGNELQIKFNTIIKNPEKSQIKGIPIEGIENIIAISSGKGGVGKSAISANIAIILYQMGYKVGVLDTDIYGPSIPKMFGVENQKPMCININKKNKIKPIENYGIKLLSIGFFAEIDQAVIWRGPMANKALHQMIRDAHWGVLDFLILDLPPGTGDIHLSIVQELPLTGAIIVSTPQNIALADAHKGIKMFQIESINVPVLGIIENMSYFSPSQFSDEKHYLFGRDGAKKLASQLEIPYLGEVPIIQEIREGSDIGIPATLNKKSITKKIFKKITQNIIEQLFIRNQFIPPTKAVQITTMEGCNPKSKNI